MKIIKKMYSLFNKMFSEQEIDKNVLYRPLRYCLKFETEYGCTACYNLLNGLIVILNKAETNAFDSQITEYTTDIEQLIKNWFLVPIKTDDIVLSDSFRDTVRLFSKKNYIDTFTIMTTTDCNARCFYCYELGCKRLNMTEKVAIDIANYIKEKAMNNNVKISWFGGEPLYNNNVIDIISKQLVNLGVNYESVMITNGYLFDRDLINKAKTLWNLQQVQITLDGTESVYNKTKAYIYKDPNAFKTVTNNIENLLKANIYVKIRLNVGKYNFQNIYELCKYIYSRYGKYSNLKVYLAMLYDGTEFENGKILVEEDDFYQEFFDLEDYLDSLGILANLKLENEYLFNSCMADADNSIVITPTGLTGRCEHFSDTELVGSIYTDEKDEHTLISWKKRKSIQSKCLLCVLYPSCVRLEKCPNSNKVCSDNDVKKKLRYIEKSARKYLMDTEDSSGSNC